MPTDLDQIIARGESEQVEFKRGIAERNAAAKTLCAMLNGVLGGCVLFGVRDEGEAIGLEIGHETHQRLRGEFSKIDPPASIDLETIPLEGRMAVLIARVNGGTGLYRYEGKPYERFGASTALMPDETYRRRLLEHHHAQSRWETAIAAGVTLADLDHDQIRQTVGAAVHNGRLSDPGDRSVDAVVDALGLTRGGQVTNAAVVLFGRDHLYSLDYPQCRLQMARFRGGTKAEFLNSRSVTGHLFSLYRAAQEFVLANIRIASKIEGFYRQDIPTYPLEAVREAIVNALCHRDYAIFGGSIDLAIYDDRMEITSPGGLHFGLTVDDLQREHISRPWNPVIAEVVYRQGIIDRWGRGTLRMAELMQASGLDAPELLDQGHSFTIRFRNADRAHPARAVLPPGLSALEREILAILEEHGPLAIGELEKHLESPVNRRQVQRQLRSLQSLGLVDRAGATNRLRWFVVT